MISYIELNNFQKHKNLRIDFDQKINIIHGKTKSGKSCIRRAFEWVLFCENIKNIQTLGSKKTSVKIGFKNGSSLERIRSASVNRYIYEENGEILKWDKFGRELPEELKTKLKLNTLDVEDQKINLNIAKQIDSPFLIGKDFSPSFKLKLFNKLTGADAVDKGIKNLSKELREKSNDKKYNEEQIESKTEELNKLKPELTEIEKLYFQLNSKFNKLNTLQKKRDELKEKLEEYNHIKSNIDNIYNQELKDVNIDMSSIYNKINKYNEIKNLHKSFLSVLNQIDALDVNILEKSLSDIDFDDVLAKIKLYEHLKTMKLELNTVNDDLFLIHKKIEDVKQKIKITKKNMETALKNIEICKECGQVHGTGVKL